MHFHLPKPLHGWREFAGEVGIIVIGVLIALAAEQVVEDLSWRHKVGVVRKSLLGELGNDRGRWEANMARVPCYRQSIEQVDEWAKSDGRGEVTGAESILSDGFFWMHSANWHLATGGGTLDHFPIDQQLAFAALYDGVGHREVDIEKAADAFQAVGSLLPLANTDQGRRDLRAALGMLKGRIQIIADNDNYMRRHFDAVGAKTDNRDIAADEQESSACAAAAAAARTTAK